MASKINYNIHIITHALENKNLLEVKDGDKFREVGAFGRLWRVLTTLLTGKNQFQDCKATLVGNAIVKFVKNNRQHLDGAQIDKLVENLRTLETRMKKYQYNISLNINTIEDLRRIHT